MNLVAKLKRHELEIQQLRARLDSIAPLTPPIAPEVPIENATIAQAPAKRRGRPPKVKPDFLVHALPCRLLLPQPQFTAETFNHENQFSLPRRGSPFIGIGAADVNEP